MQTLASARVSRRRKVLIVGTALLGVVVAAAVLLGRGGSWDTYPGPERVTPASVAGAPAWARPCWAGRHDGRPVHVFECGRLRGRVLWVLNEEVEHGGDAHLVVVARMRIRFAKIGLSDRRRDGLPGVGDRVTLVGPVVRGAHLDRQIWAWSVENRGW